MEQIIIDNSTSNQRLDKFLKKYLPNASSSFLFKMMRKKNILLNDQKAKGNEILIKEDKISIFFSEDTLKKFKTEVTTLADSISQYLFAYKKFENKFIILFESTDVLILNKPSGLLSQKSKPDDISINEIAIGYLFKTNQITEESILFNKPSICNRLDRNTSGIIIFGKTLLGLQTLNKLTKEHSIKKYYRCFLYGILKKQLNLNGFLSKIEKTNSVKISSTYFKDSAEIKTNIIPLIYGENITYAEIELITGKTHQIRAHVSSIDHAIIGDYKYGKNEINLPYKEKYSIQSQLLHAYKIQFPQMPKEFESLNKKEILAPIPSDFKKILKKEFKQMEGENGYLEF